MRRRSDVALHDTLLVVVGRGASDPDANSNVAKVARMLWEGFGFGWAETAYSGVTFPLVEPALEKAARLGFRRIVVFPYFLFTGVLVQRIYDAADAVAARHPGIEFVKAPYLNDHPLVLDTFVDRVHEILDGQNLMNCAAVQIPRADAGLRGGGRPAAGEPPPSCRGDLASGRPPFSHEGEGLRAAEGRDQAVAPLTVASPHPLPMGERASRSSSTTADHPHRHATITITIMTTITTITPIRTPTIRSGRAR